MPGSSGTGGASSIASWLSEQDWQLAAAVTPRCPLAKHPQHERRFLLRSTDSLSSSSLSALSVVVSSARWSGVSSTNHYIQQVICCEWFTNSTVPATLATNIINYVFIV